MADKGRSFACCGSRGEHAQNCREAAISRSGLYKQQRDELLSAIEDLRSAASESESWQPEADLYKTAERVRKEGR